MGFENSVLIKKDEGSSPKMKAKALENINNYAYESSKIDKTVFL
jgi:hypothetical protein